MRQIVIFLALLILVTQCSKPENPPQPPITQNPAPQAVFQINAIPLSVAGPLHLQECQMQQTNANESPITIQFDRIGARASLFVYDIQPGLPNFFTYTLHVEQGGIKITCSTEAIEHFIGSHSGWIALSDKQNIQTLQIFSLEAGTEVRIQSMSAFAVDMNSSPPVNPNFSSLPFANADFEQGNLNNWQALGDAFTTQPTFEDNPAYRWGYEGAYPQGDYWIGTFENRPGLLTPPAGSQGDKPRGILTSNPFQVQNRFLSGLIGGGHSEKCAVSILIDSKEVARFTSNQSEMLHPFVLDISEYKGRRCQIQIQDQEYTGWGHINVDNFCVFGDN